MIYLKLINDGGRNQANNNFLLWFLFLGGGLNISPFKKKKILRNILLKYFPDWMVGKLSDNDIIFTKKVQSPHALIT